MKSFLKWLAEADVGMNMGGQMFWGDNASKSKFVAAGVLPIAQDTGRVCLNHRTKKVNNWIDGKSIDIDLGQGLHHLKNDPAFEKMYVQGCYSTFGGSLNGQTPEVAAKQETAEETGYSGPWLKFETAHAWSIPGSTKAYQNFIGLIPKEAAFQFHPEGGSSWESHGILWVDWESIDGKNGLGGIRFHDGFRDLLVASRQQIVKMLENTEKKKQGLMPQQKPLMPVAQESFNGWIKKK